jgi:hypothetical protein
VSMNPVDLVKNSEQTNSRDWLRETALISYGVVTDIVQDGIVTVTQVVRDSVSLKTLTVPLMNFSSAKAEEVVEAEEGDLVLLLFLDKTAPSMFDSPQDRLKAQEEIGAVQDWTVFNRWGVGYNKFSAVGILMQPFKGLAATVTRHGKDPATGEPIMSFRTKANYQAIFRREFSMLFDALPGDSGFVDRLCEVTFGQHSPFTANHWAAVNKMYGLSVLPDGSLEVVVAPVKEVYSIHSPITKIVSGTQDIFIGKGTDGDGELDGTNTPGEVTITIGTNADVTIVSGSAFSGTFAGPLTFKTTTSDLIKIGNSANSLGPLLDSLVTALTTSPLVLITGASGGSSPMNPAIVTALNNFKTQWDAVFN